MNAATLSTLGNLAEFAIYSVVIGFAALLWLGVVWHLAYNMFKAIFALLAVPFVAVFNAVQAFRNKSKATEPGQSKDAVVAAEDASKRKEPVLAAGEPELDFEPVDVSQYEMDEVVTTQRKAQALSADESLPAQAEVSPATEATTTVVVAKEPAVVVAAVSEVKSKEDDDKQVSLETRLSQEFDAVAVSATA